MRQPLLFNGQLLHALKPLKMEQTKPVSRFEQELLSAKEVLRANTKKKPHV